MIKCPSCDKELADNALTCPNCGERRLRRRSWGDRFGIAAFVLSLVNILFTILTFIPIIGLVYYYVALFFSLSAITFAIIGVKNAVSKGKIIAAFIIGTTEFLGTTLFIILIMVLAGSIAS